MRQYTARQIDIASRGAVGAPKLAQEASIWDAFQATGARNIALDNPVPALGRYQGNAFQKPFEERTAGEKITTTLGHLLLGPIGLKTLHSDITKAPEDYSRLLSPKEIKKFYQMDVDAPMRRAVVERTLRDRRFRFAKDQITQEWHDGSISDTVLQFGMEFFTSLLDPTGPWQIVAPIVGSGGKVLQATKGAKTASSMSKASMLSRLSKGFVDEDRLTAALRLPEKGVIRDAGLGFVEGGTGTFLMDIPRIMAYHQEQGNKAMMDFFKDVSVSVFVGGAVGGTLRVGLGALSRGAQKAVKGNALHTAATKEPTIKNTEAVIELDGAGKKADDIDEPEPESFGGKDDDVHVGDEPDDAPLASPLSKITLSLHKLISKLKLSKKRFKIIEDLDKIDQETEGLFYKWPHLRDSGGFVTHDGTVYILTPNLRTKNKLREAHQVLLHEAIGHHAWKLLPKETAQQRLITLYDRIHKGDLKQVAEDAAERGGWDSVKQLEETYAKNNNMDMDSPEFKQMMADEYIAREAETFKNYDSAPSWFQDIIDAIRDYLITKGHKDISRNDIHMMLRKSLKDLQKQDAPEVGPAPPKPKASLRSPAEDQGPRAAAKVKNAVDEGEAKAREEERDFKNAHKEIEDRKIAAEKSNADTPAANKKIVEEDALRDPDNAAGSDKMYYKLDEETAAKTTDAATEGQYSANNRRLIRDFNWYQSLWERVQQGMKAPDLSKKTKAQLNEMLGEGKLSASALSKTKKADLEAKVKKLKGDKPPLIQAIDNAIRRRDANAEVGITGKARAELKKELGDEVLGGMRFANEEHASDVLDEVIDMLMYVHGQTKNADDFKADVRAQIQEMLQARQAGSIKAQKSSRSWTQLAKEEGFKGVISRLVGSFEKGINTVGASVAHSIQMAVGHRIGLLESVLDQHGVRDLFDSNDLNFMQQVMWYARGGSDLTSKEAVKGAKEVGHLIRLLNDEYFHTMTANGARIGYLKEHGGLTHKYDQKLMGAVDKQAWIREMIGDGKGSGFLDVKATFEALPWLRKGNFDDLEGYLGKFYDDVKAGRLREKEVMNEAALGGNLAAQAGKRRHIFINQHRSVEFDTKYGSGNTSQELFNQIARRAEIAETVEWFGPNYKTVQGEVQKILRKATEAEDAPKSALGKAKAFMKLGIFSHEQRFKAVMDKVVGEADHPVDRPLATFFQTIRQAMDVVSLELAQITAMATDPPAMIGMIQHLGIQHNKAFTLVNAAIREQFSLAKNGPKLMMRYRALGAGHDAWANAVATRFGGELSGTTPIAGLHKKLFQMNKLQAVTSSFQYAYMDAVERSFAHIVKNLDTMSQAERSQLNRALHRHGITPKDLDKLAKELVTDANGVERIMVGHMADSALSSKFRNMMKEGMDQAVLTPDARTTSLLHLGFQAGTWEGELMRTVTQYLPFMMATYQKTYARMINGYGDNGLLKNPITKGGTSLAQVHMLTMAVTGLAAATVGTAMKDIMKGREPTTLTLDMFKEDNMARILVQSGLLPFFDDWISHGPSLPAGPVVQRLKKLGGIDSPASAIDFGLDSIPLIDTVPLVHEAKKTLLATMMQDWYGTAWEHKLLWMEENRGGGSFLHPL